MNFKGLQFKIEDKWLSKKTHVAPNSKPQLTCDLKFQKIVSNYDHIKGNFFLKHSIVCFILVNTAYIYCLTSYRITAHLDASK